MSLWSVVLIACAFIFILILVMFPESRVLLKGFVSIFIKDLASTPEGAEKIFDQQISELQTVRDDASNSYRMAAGRLESEKKRNEALLLHKQQLEKDCEALVQAGKYKEAESKSEQRTECIGDIQRSNLQLKAFTVAFNDAKEAFDSAERNLKDAKKRARDTVENMKVQQTLKQVYDQLDENRADTSTEKLVNAIMEKNKDLTEFVDGSRAIHNSKLSTRIAKADESARKAQGDAYLASLMNKYKKN